ncbi:MAG: glycosyltransferase [Sulfitobacter sp.]
MTRVFSIFERIGLGGGGKVKAVCHRMNALAEMPEFDPILLNLDHSANQKLNFAELKANGTLAPRVQNLTVPEACYGAALNAGIQPFSGFPVFDHIDTKTNKIVYSQNGETVMVDKTKQTPIGAITKRVVLHQGAEHLYTLIDGHVHQMIKRNADDTVETTDFVRSLPIRWTKSQGRHFIIGKNLITDTICRMPRIYHQNLFELIGWDDSVVFFDGVTSAYLAPVTKGRRALFLHADHRSPTGTIVPRSKFLIENFKGEAIITSTHVHKTQIHADVTPAAEVHVIPHFCTGGPPSDGARAHLVTVSRLELVGKPIHECIEAFCLIKDSFPDVDYLIYGLGAGQQQLEEQIEVLGCGDRVRLAGYTSDPLGVFRNALASVYPTTTEGFGLSILEALSEGCPVISYDVNYGPREMIKPGENGELAPSGDILAIAEAMRRVLLKPEPFQRATRVGLERYTRQAYLSNYRNIVNMLMSLEPPVQG